MSKISGVVIAGGKSSRMGRDKAFIRYGDKFLIEYSLKLLQEYCDEIFISAGDDHERFLHLGFTIVLDEHKGIGPIAGIHAALKKARNPYLLVLPCDTPFLQCSTIFSITRFAPLHKAVYAELESKAEPLIACYSKDLLLPIEQMIREENYKLQNLIDRDKTKAIPFHQKDQFRNLNRPGDLEEVSPMREKFPKLILVAGNGRNVGKTYFSSRVIESLKYYGPISAIKISPHFHSEQQGELIHESKNCRIFRETVYNSKDSSLLLKAGAEQSFFVMSKDDGLSEVISFFKEILENEMVVCESGGLINYTDPGLFFFLKKPEQEIVKPYLTHFDPVIVNNTLKELDLNPRQIKWSSDHYCLKETE